eukprot:1801239-Alexandrium_andersonii.AAC.1
MRASVHARMRACTRVRKGSLANMRMARAHASTITQNTERRRMQTETGRNGGTEIWAERETE